MSYPTTPGHKGTDTSKVAAPRRDTAAKIRQQVLEEFQSSGPMTADECAERMRMSILTIRPRCSELKLTNCLADTGIRRRNPSTMKSAAVLKVA
jgi:predicted HTH transcriptional regulator